MSVTHKVEGCTKLNCPCLSGLSRKEDNLMANLKAAQFRVKELHEENLNMASLGAGKFLLDQNIELREQIAALGGKLTLEKQVVARLAKDNSWFTQRVWELEHRIKDEAQYSEDLTSELGAAKEHVCELKNALQDISEFLRGEGYDRQADGCELTLQDHHTQERIKADVYADAYKNSDAEPEFNRGPLAPGEDPFKEFREQVKDKVYSKPSTINHGESCVLCRASSGGRRWEHRDEAHASERADSKSVASTTQAKHTVRCSYLHGRDCDCSTSNDCDACGDNPKKYCSKCGARAEGPLK